jgi:ribonuclease D
MRTTQEMEKAAEDLRKRRDALAEELGIEASFIAPRATMESIAADGTRTNTLLVPWQRDLLQL